MNEKKKNNYPYLILNKSIDKYSDYSERNPRNSDFNLEKY